MKYDQDNTELIFKREILGKICLVDKYMTDLVSKSKKEGIKIIDIVSELNKYLIENFYADKSNPMFYQSLVRCKIFSNVRTAILSKAKASLLCEEEKLERSDPEFVEMCNVFNIQFAMEMKEFRGFKETVIFNGKISYPASQCDLEEN